jgi:hypothetical protein
MTHWMVGLALCALASLPLVTTQRVALWQSEARVWAAAAARAPTHARPRLQVGYHAHVGGQRRQAEAEYRHGLRLAYARHDRTGCRIAVHNLGVLASDEGRWQDAAQWGEYACPEWRPGSR